MERSRRKRGRGPGWKEKEEGRVTGKWKTNRTSRQWVWLDFQAAISRGSTFSWLAFVVRSLVSRRLHRCVRLSFLRFRTGTRLDFIRVCMRAWMCPRGGRIFAGTCSLNKRTAHALSRFHLDRSNEKRRNETTPGTAANRWKQVNRRMLGIRVILLTTVPRYMTRMFVSSAISLPFFLFFSFAIYTRPRFLRTNLFSTSIAMLFSFSPPWEGFFFKDFVNLFRATGKGTLDVKQW